MHRQKTKKTDITPETLAHASRCVRLLLEEAHPTQFSLLHGDLHANNAFITHKEVILFDKEPTIAAGDPLYDLALLGIDFPNGLFVSTHNPQRQKDTRLWSAFIEGYGENFIEKNTKLYAGYVLLRCLERYPNPFETYSKDVIDAILREDTEALMQF